MKHTEALHDMLATWLRTSSRQPKELILPRYDYFMIAHELGLRDRGAPMQALDTGTCLIEAQLPQDEFKYAGPKGYVTIKPEAK